MPLAIRLNPAHPAPLYEQIAQSIRDQIARGELRADEVLPTVRELACRLKVNQNTVSRAYRLLREEGLLEARSRQGTRVARRTRQPDALRDTELRLLATRFISEGLAHGYSLSEVEAAFTAQRAGWQLQHSPQSQPTVPDYIAGFGSQDLCLDVLLAQFRQAHPDIQMHFVTVGSLGGMMALARGEAHFATAHLYDPASQDYNVPFARQLIGERPLTLITLAHRAQGLMVTRGNPKHIHSLRDLTRRGIRFVNRQRGSGTRVRLDALLRKARIAAYQIRGYAQEEQTHLAVAAAIAAGQADAGLGIQAAARSFDLDFIPLVQERFELILPRDDRLIPHLLELLAQDNFQQTALALGGYDLSETGHMRHI